MSPPERLLLAAILLCGSASAAHAEADHAGIARASLTEVIHPGYAALAESAGALKGKVDNLCMSRQVSGFQWDNHAILVS